MIIHLFPAAEGDCILLKSRDGDGATSIFIDGGRVGSYPKWKAALLAALAPAKGPDLMVVTHVDADHVGGILAMLRSKGSLPIKDAWFNAYTQVREALKSLGLVPFGVEQGDKVSKLLADLGSRLNNSFCGGPVMLDRQRPNREISIGDMNLRLISPDAERLSAIEPTWTAWLSKEGLLETGPDPVTPEAGLEPFGAVSLDVEALAAMPDIPDRAIPNGTSIAFIAENGGKKALLAADAHPDMLETSIARLAEGGRLKIDIYKVAHHGSRANTSARLLSMLDCQKFVFSTDGSHHKHPDPEAVAKILKSQTGHKILYFNYRQPQTTCWHNDELMQKYDYHVVFPDDAGRLVIRL